MPISAPASAATYDLGTLSATPQTATGTLANSLASDTVTFSLASQSDIAGGIAAVKISFMNTTIYNFSSLSAGIYDSGTNNLVGSADLSTGFSQPGLSAGSYYALVSGVPTGISGGLYSLSLLATPSAAPAPGPAGLVVFGAGAGAIAFRRYRRRKSLG
ncbi:MAG: hypothetical protein R3E04_13655 [Sphingobium sp.]